mmetsp:Transcript_129451/g.295397  ORF Transcript_129451/g.295397 Transcript_129451/m.295397 type:complete len:267 (-) Transcript_129451:597-1397(-)
MATTTALPPTRRARCSGGCPAPPVMSARHNSSFHTSRGAPRPAASARGPGWPADVRLGSAAWSSSTRAHCRFPSRIARSRADVPSTSAAFGLAPLPRAACRPTNCPLRASIITSIPIMSFTASGSNRRARSTAVIPTLSRRPGAAPAIKSSRTALRLRAATAQNKGEVPLSLHWLGSAAADNNSDIRLSGALHRIAATSAGSCISGSIFTVAPRRVRIVAWSKRPQASAACSGVHAAATRSMVSDAGSCVFTRRYHPPMGSIAALF